MQHSMISSSPALPTTESQLLKLMLSTWTDTFLVTPGQTINVLLKTKPYSPNATFFMAARPYATGTGTFDNSTVAAILECEPPFTRQLPPLSPILPSLNDTPFAFNFSTRLRSLASVQYPANVPKTVDRHFFFSVGLGTNPCPKNQTCQGPTNATKFAASIRNISFSLPTSATLQSYYFGKSNGSGFGNYDPNKDPATFNLFDPIERNTIGVPSGGWVVIRFQADNPGE
ncbi:hypothetical protein K2173_001876 [Erythroxylum novogranatense]|uniref:Uncharacterized protein n=1 Tax=Erythroxylum novogranatense TaxID=1862640 RepID=A0AAV8SPS4_9ROSI|nr:hypothetical protein K2173_001876 [Erythroxylum novogranatense]